MTKPFVALTEREWAVVNAMKAGCDTAPKIAVQLNVSVSTVRNRLNYIYAKFGATGFKDLGRIVYETVQVSA